MREEIMQYDLNADMNAVLARLSTARKWREFFDVSKWHVIDSFRVPSVEEVAARRFQIIADVAQAGRAPNS